MANQEHLDILKQGVEIWNQWRETFHEGTPDLSHADLSHADLSHADLSHADLSHADLSHADLSYAYLERADLSYADLRRADLHVAQLNSANLQGANFFWANLENADLSNTNLALTKFIDADLRDASLKHAILKDVVFIGANLQSAYLVDTDLTGTDFSGANLSYTFLRGANLSYSIFNNTTLGGIDLRSVKGLESVVHRGPSLISSDSLIRSRGDIPEIFLRGVGLDDTFITYIRSMVSQAIEYFSCFISYSSKDEDFSKRLYADLQSNGVRCWFAPEDLKIGDKIRLRLDESIRLYDKLLLVFSKDSVASQWVEQEVETALEKERKEKRTVLFPIRLDTTVMEIEGGWPALIRNTRNIGDFTHWKRHDSYQKSFNRLLRDLKAES
jgi:uncharacterized protein YjbI with pentapeptide repeats